MCITNDKCILDVKLSFRVELVCCFLQIFHVETKLISVALKFLANSKVKKGKSDNQIKFKDKALPSESFSKGSGST